MIPVEGFGKTKIVGFWDEKTQKFIPLGRRKRLRQKRMKQLMRRFVKSNLISPWESSFSIVVSKLEIDKRRNVWFNPYVHDKESLGNRDIIYRLQGERKVNYKL